MEEIKLEIRNLSHKYGRSTDDPFALKDINLKVTNGEFVGFLGPSGCGKTTLLRLIAGFEKPAAGSIFLNGIEISNSSMVLPPERRGVGMVFQDYALFPHLNVWRNVCFGLKSSNDTQRAKWLLDLLGIYEFRNRFPHQLSGGQRQRVALARALAPGTSLVLLDEPFCSLDVEVRFKLRNELSNVLKSCSATGIIVTHDPHEALAICDQIGVIKDGELHQLARPQDLLENPSSSFVGQFVFQKNLIPISFNGVEYFTALGKLDINSSQILTNNSSLLFDQHSLNINKDSRGEAILLSKEFQVDKWLLNISIASNVFRVISPISMNIQVGDRCKIVFKENSHGFIFPGNYKVEL